MPREVDRRDFARNRVTTARKAELTSLASAVSDRLSGAHRIRIERFDPTTGNPTAIASENAPSERGDYVQRALDHVRSIGQALGFAPSQPAEFTPDPHVQRTSSGAAAVHLQQLYKGIPVFQATEVVRFAPDGTIKETAGSSITIAEENDVAPRISVQEAVLAAARHVALPREDEQGQTDPFGEPMHFTTVDVSDFSPQVIMTFTDKADLPTVLEGGPFQEDIRASLVWFPLDDGLRLAWEVVITMPNYEAQYRTLVDAERREILYCRQLVKCVAAQGNVFHVDGSGPRVITSFPRPLGDYGLPISGNLPSGFPDDWIATDRTQGNCVHARLGNIGPTILGTLNNGVVTFNPVDALGDAQKVVNIFYYNCYLHDFFYLLGFREGNGNFQHDNFGRGGVPADPVDARAHSGPVFGTANMATPVDGRRPIMNMGLVTSTGRHTAFDSSVVYHEGAHGLTNRLVGGPMNARALEAPQSGGMGEGWSDYIACTINSTTVVGSWVVNRAGGIRGFGYDSNFPDHFGMLGTGRYAQFLDNEGRTRVPVHNIGEIWCATLMEMGRRVGTKLALQLVVDALKLTPANPGFLDGRDAILTALDDMLSGGQIDAAAHATTRRGVWGAFARFGMGVGARSNGASLSGVVADFTEPEEATGALAQVDVAPDPATTGNEPA